MGKIARFWRLLNTPSQFTKDPYGGFLNQWGHYTGGAAFFVLSCCSYFVWAGEMPDRYVAAFLVIAGYAVFIEWRVQGWRGSDSVEDTLFVAMGALTVATSVQEMAAVGLQSHIVINPPMLITSIITALGASIIYGVTRLK